MTRRIWFSCVGFSLLMLALLVQPATISLVAAEPAAAADLKVLELLPEDALAAVVVPRLADLDAKVARLGGPLKLPVPGLLTMAKVMHGVQQGLDEQRGGAVVLVATTDANGGDPCGVGFLPTSDYQKLIGQFTPETKGQGISLITVPGTPGLLVAEKAGYAVFVGPTEEEQKLLEKVLAKPVGIPAAIAPMKSWIAQQDAALVMSQRGVKVLSQKALEGLKASLAMAQAHGGANAANVLDVYEKLFAALQQEAAQVGVGLQIDNDATVRVNGQIRLAAGGNWAKAGTNIPALQQPPLAGLPGGEFCFAFDGAWGGPSSDWMSNLGLMAMKPMLAQQSDAEISDDDWNKLTAAMKHTMTGVNSMAMTMGVPQAGSSIYSNMFMLYRVADAAAYLKSYEANITQFATLLKSLKVSMFGNYEVKKTQIDGVDALQLTTDMSDMLEKMKQQQPAGADRLQKVWDTTFGSGGKLNSYLVPAGKNTVVMTWMDPDHLKVAMAAAKNPGKDLNTDANVKATLAMLSKHPQWVVLISPSGYMKFIQTMMHASAPQLPIELPDFPQTQPVGGTVRMTADSLDAELVVPAAVLAGAGTYIQQMQQKMN